MNATTNPAAWLPGEHGEHPAMDIIPASLKDTWHRSAVVPTQEIVIANRHASPLPMGIGAIAAREVQQARDTVPRPAVPYAMPIIHGPVQRRNNAMIPEPNGARPRAMLLRVREAVFVPIIAPAAGKQTYAGIIFARERKTLSVVPKTAMKSICVETMCANIPKEKLPPVVHAIVNLKPPKNAEIIFANMF